MKLTARLFYLTAHADGAIIINLQTEAGDLWKVEIARGHLVCLILDGIKLLFSNIATAMPARARSEGAPSTSPANGPPSGAPSTSSTEGDGT